MEPDLKELAEQAVNKVMEDSVITHKSPCKVKLFKVYGYSTFDIMSNTERSFDGKEEIEKQINEFLATKDNWYIQQVDVKVVKNFFPHTQSGEYEEVWYGIVVYCDEEDEV